MPQNPEEDDAGAAWAEGIAREWKDDLTDSCQGLYTELDGSAAQKRAGDEVDDTWQVEISKESTNDLANAVESLFSDGNSGTGVTMPKQ